MAAVPFRRSWTGNRQAESDSMKFSKDKAEPCPGMQAGAGGAVEQHCGGSPVQGPVGSDLSRG